MFNAMCFPVQWGYQEWDLYKETWVSSSIRNISVYSLERQKKERLLCTLETCGDGVKLKAVGWTGPIPDTDFLEGVS